MKPYYKRSFSLSEKLLILAAIFSIITAIPVCAERTVDTTGRGAGYSAVLYDNTSGLPTSDANALVQTEEGFLWIGSYSGLIRYDGNEFYRYDSSTGMSSVVSLFADSKNRLWIGTNDSGVFLLEGNKFTNYEQGDALHSSSIRSIIEDDGGNILIASTKGMAYVDPDGVIHAIDDERINHEYVCELVRADDGTIYGVTLSGSFFTVEDLAVMDFYTDEELGYGVINTVYPDPDVPGGVYIGTQNGTLVRAAFSESYKNGEVISVEPQQIVRCIRKIDGLLWVCANNGIGFMSDAGYTTLADLPMNNAVEHVIADYEGNLWFTSSRQGLMKIVPNRFTDISLMAELPEMVVNSTCLDRGLLYLGTDSGLVILGEDMQRVENALTGLLDGARIRSVNAAGDGSLWFGTNSDYGLVCYHPESEKWEIYNSENGLASNRARTVLEMSDGTIAVATNAGVNLIRDGRITRLYDDRDGLSNLEILCLIEGPNGVIYAGSDGDGIYVLDGENVSRLGKVNGLRSEVILRIRRDAADPELYWIVTSNSIAYMRGEVITTIRNFPYSNNFDLFFDDHNRVWVLSSNGIYVVNRDNLLADDKIDYTLYDTRCGLPCAPTANSFACKTDDGTLYIAAGTGVSSVNINDESAEEGSVRLAVPFVMADDTYVAVKDGQADIPASCRRLVIYPYAFTYSLRNPHVSYRLEGFDEEAVTVTQHELGSPTYTNLAGGTYRFELSVPDTMTGKTHESLTVTLIKEKTLYEKLWFRVVLGVALALLAGGAVALYFRRKNRLLLQKQAEHKQLIDEMANVFASCIDLKDPYTNGHSQRVAKYSTMLAKKLGKDEEEIEKIYHTALLHDIGKISIPDNILNKPGRLTDEEYGVMKSHPQRGYDILKDVTIDHDLATGAGYHHERVDGRGYPKGLKGDEIPETARIIAVADTFDAMYSTRPYRKRMELSVVADEIERGAGTQFDAKVVEAFLELVREGAFDEVGGGE